MKTLLLVDRNMFLYNFMPDLHLSLKVSVYENTEASVGSAKARVLRVNGVDTAGRRSL